MSTNASSLSAVTYIILALWCPLLVRAAKFAGGTGKLDDPYQIATAEQLISIGSDPNLLNKHFVLLNDLDLDPNLPGGRTFEQAVIAPCRAPFDMFSPTFTGDFDGADHVIRNLTICSGKNVCLGLFGRIGQTGQVRSLGLENVFIGDSRQPVGGLVASSAGVITDCHVTGRIHGLSRVGGLVGQITDNGRVAQSHANTSVFAGNSSRCIGGLVGETDMRSTITSCYARGTISAGTGCGWLGGLIGSNGSEVTDCYATGDVVCDASGGNLGGLAGMSCLLAKVTRCYASGRVSAGDRSGGIGGLIGQNYMLSKITECHSSGRVSVGADSFAIGGLVGMNWAGTILDSYALGDISVGLRGNRVGGLVGTSDDTIRRCYAATTISTGNSCQNTGGLLGYKAGGEIRDCFWNLETTGLLESDGGTGRTTAQMQRINTFLAAGWDFTNTWRICEGKDYPRLQWEKIDCDQP